MAPEQLTQSEYWNGPAAERWITSREVMDRSMESITRVALELAAARPGEQVLDVGCGTGTTTLRLARQVGPHGRTNGVDISAPMIEVARSRAGSAPIEFFVADASAARFPTPFDLLFSRFGVMFFADPAAAFANLHAALAPRGRMAFVCWRALRENPWAAAPLAAARDLLPPMEPPDPNAPGPFAFADGERLRGILVAAGFRSIDIAPHDDHMFTGATVEEATDHAMMIGPLSRAIAVLPDETRAALRPRVAEVVARHARPDGVTPPAAVWLVSASA